MKLDLGARLRERLSAAELEVIRQVAEAADRLHMPLYAVGGLPRDLILGKPVHDFDLVVEGDAIRLARLLARTHGGSVKEHGRFGTAVWLREVQLLEGRGRDREHVSVGSLDLATARTETYLEPARLPHVHPASIQDDLHRRDFTINAIAIRLDGSHFGCVLDPAGGIDDLHRRRLRVLHSASFVDDPTRMYRAVRYEQRLGFHLDRGTLTQLHKAGKWVSKVSGERLRGELEMMLMEERASEMLRRLSKLGLLRKIHPGLPADSTCLRRLRREYARRRSQQIPRAASREILRLWSLWLMGLSAANLRSVGRRLAFGGREMRTILDAAELNRNAMKWARWSPSRLTQKLDAMEPLAVETVLTSLPLGRASQQLERYLHSWRQMRPHVTGRDLLALGLTPGPEYQSILQALRFAWIDGSIGDDDGERRLLQRMLGARAVRMGRARAPKGVRSKAHR